MDTRIININTGMMKKTKENMADQKESFGTRLAMVRKEAGYTQNTLAEETGISKRMIVYYESQGGRIPADLLLKIADALGVTIDELMGRKRNKGAQPQNQRLRKKILQIEKLPQKDRETVIRVIDGMLDKKKAS